jgi:hypothetical protein
MFTQTDAGSAAVDTQSSAAQRGEERARYRRADRSPAPQPEDHRGAGAPAARRHRSQCSGRSMTACHPSRGTRLTQNSADACRHAPITQSDAAGSSASGEPVRAFQLCLTLSPADERGLCLRGRGAGGRRHSFVLGSARRHCHPLVHQEHSVYTGLSAIAQVGSPAHCSAAARPGLPLRQSANESDRRTQ